jgi:general secretion pathway protein D
MGFNASPVGLAARRKRLRAGSQRTLALVLAAALSNSPVFAAAPPARASSAPQDTVTLNFVDADIVAATQAIGKFLHKDFLIDPRVKGTVTITTDHPVTRDEAFRLLLGALRFQGYTIVDVDGLDKVLPEADAKFAGGPTAVSKGAGHGDEIETMVFHLNYESANNLLTTLRPLITANNPITVNPGNNSLVITDYADNLRRIAKLVAAIDVPSSADADVVPLNYAVATDLAPVLQKMLDSPQGANPDPGQRVLVVAEPRTNALLLRAASPARLALARQLIAKLDIGTAAAGNIHMVYLRNAEATKLAQTLRAVITQDANAQPPASTPPLTPPGNSVGGTSGAAGTALNTISSALGSGGSSSLGNTGAGAAGTALTQNPFGSNSSSSTSSGSSGGGFIQADPQTNALIITAPEAVFRNLLPIIQKLDVRRSQVFVESLIVEVTADKAAQFGIQWQGLTGYGSSGTNVVGGTNFNGTGTGTNILGIAANPASVGTGLNIGIVHGQVTIPGIGTITNLGFLAQALESDTNTNILSTPNLLTLDNEEASIIVGQTVPFITGSYAATGSTTTVTPFQTVEEKDIGLTLKIKPQIADNGTIKMQIYQEDSSIQSTTTQGYIITNKRAVETNVQVDDGQIIVLGGLVQDTVQDTNEQVPLLGSVPLIGSLFRYRTRSRNKTDLMIFLRPYVVRDTSDSNVVNSKYDAMQRREREVQPPHDPVLPDMVAPVLPDREQAPVPSLPSSDNVAPVVLPPNSQVRVLPSPSVPVIQ